MICRLRKSFVHREKICASRKRFMHREKVDREIKDSSIGLEFC